MVIGSESYYSEKSKKYGWSKETAKLDQKRVELLNRYVVGKRTLDIGCGTGIYVDYLTSMSFDSTGVDFVKEFIDNAKKEKRGKFLLAKAENLPFESAEFDTVILFDILEHVDEEAVFKEAMRVMRKRILVIVPRAIDKDLEDSGVVFRHYIDKSHIRDYSENDLKYLAQKFKLKLLHIESVHPIFNRSIFWHLFEGPELIKKFLIRINFWLLKPKYYPTEYFIVFERE